MFSWVLIFISAIFSTAGNILIKIASENWNAGNFYGLLCYGLIGVFFYFLNLAGFVIALRFLNISIAYPVLASTSFVFLAISSNFILNESLTKLQILAITLIILGLILLVTKQ